MKLKNLMLGIVGGLLTLSVITISCSKSSTPAPPPPAVPTISGISPSTDTVGQVITITGTNLTGATVKIGGVTATITASSSTSITTKVPAGVAVGSAAVIVTTSGGASSPFSITISATNTTFTIDGLTSSNMVSPTNLIAYWPFDGNTTEQFSTVNGTTISGGPSNNGTVAYVAGTKGQAISFTNAGLIYNPIANLDSINQLQRYTISMWVNMPPNNVAEYPGGSPGEESSLFQVNGDWYNDIWGLAAVEVKTNSGYTGDTLGLSAELTQIDGTGPHTDDNDAVLNPRTTPSQYFGGAGKWSFITETYDDATDSVYIYGNGHLYLGTVVNILPNIGTGETFTLNPFGAPTNQVTFGSFMFGDEFGASNTYAAGAPFGHPGLASTKPFWTHGINASLDEVRVYKTVLSAGEINDLYQLGLHGQ